MLLYQVLLWAADTWRGSRHGRDGAGGRAGLPRSAALWRLSTRRQETSAPWENAARRTRGSGSLSGINPKWLKLCSSVGSCSEASQDTGCWYTGSGSMPSSGPYTSSRKTGSLLSDSSAHLRVHHTVTKATPAEHIPRIQHFSNSLALHKRTGGAAGEESACQCRKCGFHPWVSKIPWRRKWQPTPVFLPGKPHGQTGLAGYSPWGAEMGQDWAHTHGYTNSMQNPALLHSGAQSTPCPSATPRHVS